MKSKLITYFIFISLLFIANNVTAQPGFDDNVEDTPIDGGIGLLVGSGLIFGIKTLKSKKREEE